MRFKADFYHIDAVVREMKDLIDRLQGNLVDQEKDILDLYNEKKELETALRWFTKQNQARPNIDDELNVWDERDKYKNLYEMSRADLESNSI